MARLRHGTGSAGFGWSGSLSEDGMLRISSRFFLLGAYCTLVAGVTLGCRNGREHALGTSGADAEAGSGESPTGGSGSGGIRLDGSMQSDATSASDTAPGATTDTATGTSDGLTTKPPLGSHCSANAECASGFCVDGVCCEDMCAGSCDTCNGTTPGRCTQVTGTPSTGHASCPAVSGGMPTCAAGKCDFTCTGMNQRCGNQCLSPAQPCNNQCPGGQRLCSNMCVPAQCCGDSDCGVCQECVSGACRNQTVGQDKKSECGGRGCNGGTCRVSARRRLQCAMALAPPESAMRTARSSWGRTVEATAATHPRASAARVGSNSARAVAARSVAIPETAAPAVTTAWAVPA